MMPARTIVLATCLLAGPALASPLNELAPGARYMIEPEQASCFSSAHADPPPEEGGDPSRPRALGAGPHLVRQREVGHRGPFLCDLSPE